MKTRGLILIAAVIIIVIMIVVGVRSVSYIMERGRQEHLSTRTMTELAAEAAHLVETVRGTNLQETAAGVYDALRYSDPVSTVFLEEIDTRIQREFEVFKSAAMEGDDALSRNAAHELILLIDERSSKCRVMK